MSYFSNLSVEELEREDRDRSYPSPDLQMHLQLETMILAYLAKGGTMQEVQACLCEDPRPLTVYEREMLHSPASLGSPSRLLKCIGIAWRNIRRNTGASEEELLKSLPVAPPEAEGKKKTKPQREKAA